MESLKNYYWPLQIAGWSLLLVMVYVSSTFTMEEISFSTPIYFTLIILIGFVYSHIYRNLLKNRDWVQTRPSNLFFLFIGAPYIMAIIWALSIIPLGILFFESGINLTVNEVFQLSLQLYLVYLGWTLIYAFYKISVNFRKSEIEKWKLEASVKDAQLIALKSQINPHFIFNSLNNIRSLIIENPEKSREMITHLSGLLRYSIQFNNKEKVTVREEISIVKNYLHLESIQFEDRLKFRIELDERISECKIPPMTIQVLVENAIKHGISKIPEGGEVIVRVSQTDGNMVMEVINSGQLINGKESDSTGIGLKNANERMKYLFGEMASFTIENNSQNQVEARYLLPINSENYEVDSN